MLVGTVFPKAGQDRVLGIQSPDKPDLPGDPTPAVDNEESPAPVVPADLRAGQVYRAESFSASRFVAKKRAGVGECFKDAFVVEERDLIRIDGDNGFFSGVLIMDYKPVITDFFSYYVNVPQFAAAIPALEAFE